MKLILTLHQDVLFVYVDYITNYDLIIIDNRIQVWFFFGQRRLINKFQMFYTASREIKRERAFFARPSALEFDNLGTTTKDMEEKREMK